MEGRSDRVSAVDAVSVEHDFAVALPPGWRVSVSQVPTGWLVRASHALFGDALIGPKKRLVPADVEFLRSRVDEVVAPKLTYSQWLASGERFGFHGRAEMTSLTRALRLLAICIERGDVEAAGVAQALFARDDYTVPCPVAEASNFGANVAELVALLDQAAAEFGRGISDATRRPVLLHQALAEIGGPIEADVRRLAELFAENGHEVEAVEGVPEHIRLVLSGPTFVNLWRTRSATVQGKPTDEQRVELVGLLRADGWKVK